MHYLISGRAGGSSTGCYAGLNLGLGSGDQSATVHANRRELAKRIGLGADRVLYLRQVHGTDMVTVTKPSELAQLAEYPADGAVTTQPGIALAVLVADCVPILACDPVAGVIGGAHAGRSGAQAGIARTLMAAMVASGASIGHIDVLLGPAVCGACYEVPMQMQGEVDVMLPGSACRSHAGTPALDLRAGLARQLRELTVGRVRVDPRCTREDLGLFSHRRQAPTGRQAAVIWQ